MLNRTAKLVAAVAVAMLALPAAAGSWPPTPPRKAPAKLAQVKVAQVNASEPAINGFIAEPGENVASLAPYTPTLAQGVADAHAARSGFEFVGGETGWQPTGHKFILVGGAFVHSEDCDHAIRVVAGPTPAEVERAKRLSPGA